MICSIISFIKDDATKPDVVAVSKPAQKPQLSQGVATASLLQTASQPTAAKAYLVKEIERMKVC